VGHRRFAPHAALRKVCGQPGARAERTIVTEVQAEAPGALNIERIYSTTVPSRRRNLPGRWRITSARRSSRHRSTAPARTAR
jgi:hypothetical protein